MAKMAFSVVPVKTQRTLRRLQGPPRVAREAPEEPPGAFRASLGLPFEHLGGSFSKKLDDREPFLSEKHVPTWADDEKNL